MEKVNILNLTKDELREFVVANGMKKYNADQIFVWLHSKIIRKLDEMTNISKSDREKLSEVAYFPYLELLEHQVSKKDGTEKFLFELEDKLTVETVLIRHKERMTVCVSTQVGCPVKCAFCATGIGGFKRNLTLAEILNQIYFIQRRLAKKERDVTNIVFMGMGEPMLNIENLINSLKIISSEDGLAISMRKIVISTSGIIPGIIRLMEEKLPVGMAISLHAPNDEKRDMVVPINKSYPIGDLMDILRQYQKITKRRITFEYVLLKDFNVSYSDADQLADLMKKIDHTLNLIPYNPVKGTPFHRPDDVKITKFFEYLRDKHGLNVTIRHERGTDINGACGQLREKRIEG